MNSEFCYLAQALDPRIEKQDDWVELVSSHMQSLLRNKYGVTNLADKKDIGSWDGFNFFQFEDNGKANVVDIYFLENFKRYCHCKDVMMWWQKYGKEQYFIIAKISRDVLMTPGSSVPSKAAFSKSRAFVLADCSCLSNIIIKVLMKLCAWNKYYRNEAVFDSE